MSGGEIKNCKEGVAISGYNNPISKVTLGGNVKITGNEYGIYSNFNVNSGDTDYSAEITIEDSALITNNSTCGMYVYVGSNAGNDVIKITCTDIDSHIKDNPSKQYRIPDTSNVVSSVNFNGQTLTQILQK